MKKIYSLITALAFAAVSFGQAPIALNAPTKIVTKTRTIDRTQLKAAKKNAASKTTATNAGWFNYGTSIEALLASTSELNGNYLFPDSMGYADFGGTQAPIWIHHVAELVDFKSYVFSADPLTSWIGDNPTAPFVLDSMSIVYSYTRNHPDLSIVDTLIFTVFDNQTTTNFGQSGFIGTTAANYGTDTVTFKRVGYNQAGNFIAAPTVTTSVQVAPVGQYVFKVLLTIQDTAVTNYAEKAVKLPMPFSSIGGKLVMGDVSFKPGYTYSLTESVDVTANTFLFTSYEEKGAGTFPTYLDCNYGSPDCDYSTSYILPQDVRYNLAASWNYRFIPSYAYGDTYSYEHHLISFHLTDDMTTGIKESAIQTDISLGQNIPNPFTKESIVKYNLVKSASSAVFTVTDVMGRIISSEKVNTTTGNHSIKLGAYAAGLYYYSLNVDGNVTTKKMIVE